jgi:ribulose-phosphate 3-epimerase
VGIQITPSILTADFADLGAEVRRLRSADWVHADVMDNHFVPNLTFGPRMIEALVQASPVPVDAHLMITELDMVLVMTVEPGFGGQSFLDLCLPKIRRARELMDKHGVETWLQVDGGVSLETIERCAEAGADVFVAGSAVYDADDPDAMVVALRDRARAVADGA